MKNNQSIKDILGQTDIYLLDQIMKERYSTGDVILDAGCGTGRNMHWFLQNDFNICGTDINEWAISELKKKYPGSAAGKFQVCPVEDSTFPTDNFDHIICSAVLHFAKGTAHFHKMIKEMVRILKPGGSLFVRMTSDIGIENKIKLISDGVYLIPDGSKRFLLTKSLLADIMYQNKLSFLEPLKTVNVDDSRCMSTLLLTKKYT